MQEIKCIFESATHVLSKVDVCVCVCAIHKEICTYAYVYIVYVMDVDYTFCIVGDPLMQALRSQTFVHVFHHSAFSSNK